MGRKERNSQVESRRPVVIVRSVGGQWVARCPVRGGCGRGFTKPSSEQALAACVAHAYPKHRWTAHDVKFP